jgi:hypothetical protein
MSRKNTCDVCGKYGYIVTIIYSATGRVAYRCSDCFMQPEDFKGNKTGEIIENCR